MINKKIFFLGFKPVQWVIIASFLFLLGFFIWWLAILMIIPIYITGRNISRANAAGNPDLVMGLIVWHSFKKYFIDSAGIFNKLNCDGRNRT